MRKFLVPLIALLFATSMIAVHAPRTFADPRDFHVTNQNPSLTVTALYVDATGPGDFETELLGGGTIAPNGDGGTVHFDPNIAPGQCTYDFLAQYSDGSTREFDGLNLCQISEITIS